MRERVFRYVLHSRRAAYEAVGWIFAADLGLPHGIYSVLMEWPHESEAAEPESADAR
ncbi:hypothetical protein [Methylocystis iwaonis]|uniref:hypothetical protein n=1 Tax=Methylocystis iwaonis TaxID=2885079 RepID=UPI002E7B40EA|nr:hypothetical protein [Methylocystis iwaonis]